MLIKFKASLDPNHKCVFIDGNGAAQIKFETDESQIVSIIKSIAYLRGKCFEVTLKPSQDIAYAKRPQKNKTARRVTREFKG